MLNNRMIETTFKKLNADGSFKFHIVIKNQCISFAFKTVPKTFKKIIIFNY